MGTTSAPVRTAAPTAYVPKDNLEDKVNECCRAYERFMSTGSENDLLRCYPGSMVNNFKAFYSANFPNYSESSVREDWREMLSRYGVSATSCDSAFIPICYHMLDLYEDCGGSAFSITYSGRATKGSVSSAGLRNYIGSTTSNIDPTGGGMINEILNRVTEVYEVELTVTAGGNTDTVIGYLLKYEGTWFLVNIGE
ncbi:MAG: hypothetical protein J5854_06300 [Clostridia bacterium]|nr:hypothetical protein [Clostridia bacterium]